MAEFSIIDEFCHGLGPNHQDTILGVGDDAAIISVPADMELAISVDTMVAGVHFYPDASPESLAHKLLAVNLSDMAAMGAIPKWATLSLTIPDVNRAWLSSFSNALRQNSILHGVQVVGGDTTQGPLSLSINIMGLLPKGKALCRHGAELQDDVYVSHYLGDAALGLLCVQNKLDLGVTFNNELIAALERPIPRVALGQSLLPLASSCLDVSDGLVGDLEHICERSDVSVTLEVDKIPLSNAYKQYVKQGGDLNLALNGGDDYELAFTANAAHRKEIQNLAANLGLTLSRIGQVALKAEQKVSLIKNGHPYKLEDSNSFEHFC